MSKQNENVLLGYRQGDVPVICTNEAVPENAVPIERDRGRVVLAYGEVTGHAHAIVEQGAQLFSVPGQNYRLLTCKEEMSLRHEEHGEIKLPPGTYRVFQQQEYTPEALRNVAD